MPEVVVNPELFVLPHSKEPDKYILHVPLQRTAAKVGGGIVNLLKRIEEGQPTSESDLPLIETLKKGFFVIPQSEIANIQINCSEKRKTDYKPTSVTLMPTLNCNLACTYCYSNGGCGSAKIMPLEVAKTAIDFIIANAQEVKKESVSLGYHGGGEPLLKGNMPFIKETSNYFKQKAKENNLKYSVSSATNGTLDRANLEWIVENFDHLNISLDGTERIQNLQRPLRGPNGSFSPSFQRVLDTIQYLESKKFPYGIRATITKESVSKMPEILTTFYLISNAQSFHLEPMFKCGRSKTTGIDAPSAEEFTKYSLETRKLADKFGVSIYFSGCRLEGINDKFCGAVDSNFFITPEGIVSTCLEECRSDDPNAGNFFLGRYNPVSKSFDINMEKLGRLRNRTIDQLPGCQDCFIKYNCSGYCPKKVQSATGSMFSSGEMDICKTNIAIAQYELEKRLDSQQKLKTSITQ